MATKKRKNDCAELPRLSLQKAGDCALAVPYGGDASCSFFLKLIVTVPVQSVSTQTEPEKVDLKNGRFNLNLSHYV